MQEIEVKILEVEVDALRKKIEALGGHLHFSGELHAIFFDDEKAQIKANGEVLRLRKEGEKVVMAYKAPISKEGSKIMEEYETEVSDLQAMRSILQKLGFEAVTDTRKFRDEYLLNDSKVVIDDYQDALSHIPPFIEVESPSEESLRAIVELLGFSDSACKAWDTRDLVRHYASLRE
jgi:predicted adenylyl cyclase CyaB